MASFRLCVMGHWLSVIGVEAFGGSKEMLPQRHVRDQHVRHILNRSMIPALKTFAGRVRPDQPARLVEQRVTVRQSRFIGCEQLVDLNHQP